MPTGYQELCWVFSNEHDKFLLPFTFNCVCVCVEQEMSGKSEGLKKTRMTGLQKARGGIVKGKLGSWAEARPTKTWKLLRGFTWILSIIGSNPNTLSNDRE